MGDLILASTSRWRREMLAAVGILVEAVAPGVDERALVAHGAPGAQASDLAQRLAGAKADAVAARHPGRWILAADQLATDGAEVFGKPDDAEDHVRRLRNLRGRSHALVTGWCLVGPDGGRRGGVEETRLLMRSDLTDAELAAYVASGEGSGCAGGYAIEGRGAFLFERTEGDWFNIVGLPLFAVIGGLRGAGWRHRDGQLRPPETA